MLMRRTIGISVAFLVISTGAMAAPPDMAGSHRPDQPCSGKSQRAAQRTGKTQLVSANPSGSLQCPAQISAAGVTDRRDVVDVPLLDHAEAVVDVVGF